MIQSADSVTDQIVLTSEELDALVNDLISFTQGFSGAQPAYGVCRTAVAVMITGVNRARHAQSQEKQMSDDKEREHIPNAECWCNPAVKHVPPLDPLPVDETVGPLDEYRGQ